MNAARPRLPRCSALRALWRPLWLAVRTTPGLTAVAAWGGVAGILLLGWHLTGISAGVDGTHWQVAIATSDQALRDFQHHFRSEMLRFAALMLAPAFVLSLLRGRGRDLLLPVTLASLWFFIYWLEGDLHRHGASAVITKLGEIPSLPAYYLKLVVTGVAILSPPVMLWLYFRATVLDRYLLRNFLAPFALCFGGLIALFIIFDLLDNGRDFMEAQFRGRDIALFYLIQLPKVIVEVIDISLLLAVLYALSRMSRYNELIAMISAGRSVGRILLPLMLVGVFASLFAMACNYQWAPEADRRKSDMLRVAGEAESSRKQRQSRAAGDRVAYMNRAPRDPSAARRFWYLHEVPIDLGEKNKIDQVEVHEFDAEGRLQRSIYAKNAFWMPSEPPVWIFYNVREFLHGRERGELLVDRRLARLPITTFEETPWRLLSENAKIPAEFLTMPQLASYLNTNHDAPEFRLASYRTWWHERLARPLRCLVVILFAAPLGIVYSRRGLMGSVGTSILLYFAMYFLTSIFIRLGETYKLPAPVAAWSVNVIFGTVGLLLLWQRSRNRELRHLLPFPLFKKA